MRSLPLLGVLGLGLLATACSAPAVDGPDASENASSATSSAATGLVVVERTTGPGDAVRADAVIARFVRVHQGTVDDQALRIAGVVWDLPALGTCSTHAALDEQAGQVGSPAPRAIDLLDVGVLTLDPLEALGTLGTLGTGASPSAQTSGQTSGQAQARTTMLPRTMFDPTGGVSGVFYSGRSAAGSDAFVADSRLQLRTSGGADLPEGFAVGVDTPREVTDVRVGWADADLDVTWETPEEDARDARDLVYVDVLSSAAAGARLVARCTTSDAGHLVIPAASLAALARPGDALGQLGQLGQIAVHRLHREAFRAKGIDPGEVRFDVARVVTFRR